MHSIALFSNYDLQHGLPLDLLTGRAPKAELESEILPQRHSKLECEEYEAV